MVFKMFSTFSGNSCELEGGTGSTENCPILNQYGWQGKKNINNANKTDNNKTKNTNNNKNNRDTFQEEGLTNPEINFKLHYWL